MRLQTWSSLLLRQLAALIFALFVASGTVYASATAAASAAAVSAAAVSAMQSRHAQQADQQAQALESSVESVIGADKRPQKGKPKLTSDRAWRLLTGFVAVLIFLISASWDEGRLGTCWVGIVWSILLLLLAIFGSETIVKLAVGVTVLFVVLGPVLLVVFYWFFEKFAKRHQQTDEGRLSQSRGADSLAAENAELLFKNNELQQRLSCSENERKILVAKLDLLEAECIRASERAETLERLNKSLFASTEKLGKALSQRNELQKDITKLRSEFFEYALSNDHPQAKPEDSESQTAAREEFVELLAASARLQESIRNARNLGTSLR